MTARDHGEDEIVREYADERGLVRRWGMWHRGVPWLLRVLIVFKYDRDRPWLVDRFPGCGCIDRVKTWMERAQAWMDRDPWQERIDGNHRRSRV